MNGVAPGRFALLDLLEATPVAAILSEGLFVPHGRPRPTVELHDGTAAGRRLGFAGRFSDLLADHEKLVGVRSGTGDPRLDSPLARNPRIDPDFPEEDLVPLWFRRVERPRVDPERLARQLDFVLREFFPLDGPPAEGAGATGTGGTDPPHDPPPARTRFFRDEMSLASIIPRPGLLFTERRFFHLSPPESAGVLESRLWVRCRVGILVCAPSPWGDLESLSERIRRSIEERKLRHRLACDATAAAGHYRKRTEDLEQILRERTGFKPIVTTDGRWLHRGEQFDLFVPPGHEELWVTQQVPPYGVLRNGAVFAFPGCLVGVPCPDISVRGPDIERLSVLKPGDYPHPYVYSNGRICLGSTPVKDLFLRNPIGRAKADATLEALRIGVNLLMRGIHSKNTNTAARSWDTVVGRLGWMPPGAAKAAGFPVFPYDYYEHARKKPEKAGDSPERRRRRRE